MRISGLSVGKTDSNVAYRDINNTWFVSRIGINRLSARPIIEPIADPAYHASELIGYLLGLRPCTPMICTSDNMRNSK